MVDRTPTSMMSDEAFAELTLRYLESDLSETEGRVLNDALLANTEKREHFVTICTHAGVMHESLNHELSDRILPEPSAMPAVAGRIGNEAGQVASSGLGPFARAAMLALSTGLIGLVAGFAWLQTHPADPGQDAPYHAELTDQAGAHWAYGDRGIGAALSSEPLKLQSGFAEIRFGSGAAVILEGPAEFRTLGANRGELLSGRATATVPKGAEGFTVETPFAKVVDLGTAFGVSVEPSVGAEIHVFTGRVVVEPAAGGAARHLAANSAVRCVAGSKDLTEIAADAGRFVRRLHRRFDLSDVVAGGDGFMNKRHRGINPATGDVSTQSFIDSVSGAGVYRPVAWHAYIDGVFIPDGGDGPVALDSAGHAYWNFPDTEGASHGPVWSGGKFFARLDRLRAVRTTLGGVDYGTDDRSVIGMHANKGITFDLDAIRLANPAWSITRFHAVAGNTETAQAIDADAATKNPPAADVWVFVDGRERFSQTKIRAEHGAFEIDVPITDQNRFLTLVATDSGNRLAHDWIIFGDPSLDMQPRVSNTPR